MVREKRQNHLTPFSPRLNFTPSFPAPLPPSAAQGGAWGRIASAAVSLQQFAFAAPSFSRFTPAPA